MEFVCKWFLGPLVLTFVLIGVFESVNPPSWPKAAVGFELLGCYVVIAAILGRDMVKQEERERQDAAKMEMEKHLAELRSKEQVELEKHRLTLEAQRPKQDVVS